MINIAIDGPAGAGKSSVAKAVSKKLGYKYIDTGAMYRTIAFYILKNNIDYNLNKDFLNKIKIDLKFINDEQHLFLNNTDITNKIRTEEISMLTSKISSKDYIRKFLLNLQKDISSKNNVIMDGRDIGSVILPNAQVKIFLTASAEKRAKRRFTELLEKGTICSYDKIFEDIFKRDENDTTRKIAPLKMANDAILIDTSKLNLEQSINTVYNTIISKLNKKGMKKFD